MKGTTHLAYPSSSSESSDTCSYPLALYGTGDNFSAQHRGFLAGVQIEIDPSHFPETIKHPK